MLEYLILWQPVLLVACGVYIMDTAKKRKVALKITDLAEDLVNENMFLAEQELNIRIHLIEEAIITSTHEQ